MAGTACLWPEWAFCMPRPREATATPLVDHSEFQGVGEQRVTIAYLLALVREFLVFDGARRDSCWTLTPPSLSGRHACSQLASRSFGSAFSTASMLDFGIGAGRGARSYISERT